MKAAEYLVAALGWGLMLYFQAKSWRLEQKLPRLTDAYLEALSGLRHAERDDEPEPLLHPPSVVEQTPP